jgi:phosphate ABC transporter phosphate-binding protein
LETVLQHVKIETAPEELASQLVREGWLTDYQAHHLINGRSGFMVGGKYRLLDLIGSGGNGKVFLCEHTHLQRAVALKVLPAQSTSNPAVVERFYREGRAVAALKHPNVVQVFDLDKVSGGHYMVMEFVDGNNLHTIVSNHGPLSVLRACHYIYQTALGLQQAHLNGWVHRDIKPGNLLLGRDGVVKILDLGLARLFDDQTESVTAQYEPKSVLGTVDFMSPEQAHSSSGVDIRADIYSLGATFYFLLTGSPPFKGGTAIQKLAWHQLRTPEPVGTLRPEVPDGVNEVVQKMLAKEPSERYQTPSELCEALRPWTNDPIGPPPETEMPIYSPRLKKLGLGTVGGRTSDSGLKLESRLSPDSSSILSFGGGLASGQSGTLSARSTAGPGRMANSAHSVETPVIPHRKPLEKPTKSFEQSSRQDESSRSKVRKKQKRTEEPSRSDFDPAEYVPTRRVSWLVFSAVVLGVIGCTAMILALANPTTIASLVGWNSGPKTVRREPANPKSNKPQPTMPSVETKSKDTKPAETPPPIVDIFASEGRRALVVSTDQVLQVRNPGKVFPSLERALEKAEQGDVIRVVPTDAEPLEETLRLDGSATPANITIEGFHSKGGSQPVSWQPPATHSAQVPLVTLKNVKNLRLRNFHFLGRDVQESLVQVQGFCPGLLLENLHFDRHKRSGLSLLGALGDRDEPLLLKRLRFSGKPLLKTHTAILVENSAEVNVEEVIVEDCRFEGPCESAVRLKGTVAEFNMRQNRVHKIDSVVLYEGIEPRPRCRLKIENNTFFEVDSALRFQLLPDVALKRENRITLRNNLFAQTQALVRIDEMLAEASLKAKELFGTLQGNIREPSSCQEGVFFSEILAREVAPLPTLLDNDATFLRYPSDSSLSKMGFNGGPVGAVAGALALGLEKSPVLRGGGASFVAPAQLAWKEAYRKLTGVNVEYQSKGSSAGESGAIDRSFDFGCTEAPLDDERMAKARSVGGEMVHVPLVMGAVVPTYNLPGVDQQLRFSQEVLADIFLGKIRKWNDPALVQINPRVQLPDLEITTVHRSDGSGTTNVWTDALCKFSKEWETKVGRGNTVKWPNGIEGKGNEGVAGQVNRTVGAVGYNELSYAIVNRMKFARVANREGEYVTPDLKSITAAAHAAMTEIPEDLRYRLTNAPGKDSYPIVGTSWALIYQRQQKEKRDLIVDYLRWCVTDGQQLSQNLSYAPLPPELVNRIRRKLDSIQAE